ncbi:hypothetical protein M427DRAFT_32226 [Gonapodya prolifera JEL478]|uniref:F-box domain-containing protein n=1 Tax=Gonapodya prolifera (strain JEL478) TaxID=1344416 RepID=A0A139AGJ5_GONPJ|nr:hypothetical protein M427DRAFT_32226 [Gonapodya prolifera JEL478]|eukprot:KXS15533.1 hypothetical protein M427DRAFT_32226 [Gonapodya prolifera JEL478]
MSLNALPNETLLAIFERLPPQFLLTSIVRIARRYRHLVAQLFRPDGRPGILFDIKILGNEQVWKRTFVGFRAQMQFFPRFVVSADGRRNVVGTLEIGIDRFRHNMDKMDFRALANQVGAFGHISFVDINKIDVHVIRTMLSPLRIAIWITDPVCNPKELVINHEHTLQAVYCLAGGKPTLLREVNESRNTIWSDYFYAIPRLSAALPTLKRFKIGQHIPWETLADARKAEESAVANSLRELDLHIRYPSRKIDIDDKFLRSIATSLCIMFPHIQVLYLRLSVLHYRQTMHPAAFAAFTANQLAHRVVFTIVESNKGRVSYLDSLLKRKVTR